jgi:hypothetical protein
MLREDFITNVVLVDQFPNTNDILLMRSVLLEL